MTTQTSMTPEDALFLFEHYAGEFANLPDLSDTDDEAACEHEAVCGYTGIDPMPIYTGPPAPPLSAYASVARHESKPAPSPLLVPLWDDRVADLAPITGRPVGDDLYGRERFSVLYVHPKGTRVTPFGSVHSSVWDERPTPEVFTDHINLIRDAFGIDYAVIAWETRNVEEARHDRATLDYLAECCAVLGDTPVVAFVCDAERYMNCADGQIRDKEPIRQSPFCRMFAAHVRRLERLPTVMAVPDAEEVMRYREDAVRTLLEIDPDDIDMIGRWDALLNGEASAEKWAEMVILSGNRGLFDELIFSVANGMEISSEQITYLRRSAVLLEILANLGGHMFADIDLDGDEHYQCVPYGVAAFIAWFLGDEVWALRLAFAALAIDHTFSLPQLIIQVVLLHVVPEWRRAPVDVVD